MSDWRAAINTAVLLADTVVVVAGEETVATELVVVANAKSGEASIVVPIMKETAPVRFFMDNML